MARGLVGKIVTTSALLLLLAAPVLAQLAPPGPAAPPPVTIAIGNFGDQAEFDEQDAYVEWWYDSGPGDLHGESRRLLVVEGPMLVADAMGLEHNALRERMDTVNGSFSQQFFMDYEKRSMVRHDQGYTLPARKPLTDDVTKTQRPILPTQADGRLKAVALAPDFRNVGDDSGGTEPTLTGIELQGMRLELGMDLSWIVSEARYDPFGDNWTLQYGVDMAGTYQGQPALRVSFTESMWSPSKLANGTPSFIFINISRTSWFTSAYPFALETRYVYSNEFLDPTRREKYGVEIDYVNRTLSAYRPGAKPIPWGPTFDHRFAASPVGVTWSRMPNPSSGASGFRGVFSLEAALDSVAHDKALVQFSLWKLEHPQSRLMGLRYEETPQDSGPPVHAWTLTWGTVGEADVFRIRSDRSSSGTIANREEGRRTVVMGPLQPAWVPDRFPDFEWADRHWQRITDASTYQRGPNRIYWGLQGTMLANTGAAADTALLGMSYGYAEDRGPNPFIANPGARLESGDYVQVDHRGEFMGGFRIDRQPVLARLPATNLLPQGGVGPADAAPASWATRVLPWAAAATTAVALLALVAYVYPALKQGVLVLYTKLTHAQVLDHHLRDDIAHTIQQNPGISPPKIQRATGSPWSTLTYHLGVLSRERVITSVRDGRHRRFFLVGSADHSRLPALAVLQNPRTAETLRIVGSSPGIDRGSVAQRLRMSRTAVLFHLERLTAHALLRAEKQGRSVRYFPNSDPVSGPAAAPSALAKRAAG